MIDWESGLERVHGRWLVAMADQLHCDRMPLSPLMKNGLWM